jgi:hypothetical protein
MQTLIAVSLHVLIVSTTSASPLIHTKATPCSFKKLLEDVFRLDLLLFDAWSESLVDTMGCGAFGAGDAALGGFVGGSSLRRKDMKALTNPAGLNFGRQKGIALAPGC